MAAAMTDILPGLLAWAPDAEAPELNAEEEFALALDLCRLESPADVEKGNASYSVTHYTEAATGRAFGPLGLPQVLRFCRSLASKLEKLEGLTHKLVLGTPPGDEEGRTNACMLLGAYLILARTWTVSQVSETLGKVEADRRFVCSWARKDRPEPRRNMKVSDCWLGLELVRNNGWFDPICLASDVGTDFTCSKLRTLVSTYDASWLIPGFIMVCADPVTTALDPNPATFKDLLPKDGKLRLAVCDSVPCSPKSLCASTPTAGGQNTYDLEDVDSFSTRPTESQDVQEQEAAPATRPSRCSDIKMELASVCDSTDTVCKEYRLALCAPLTAALNPLDFVSFAKQNGIGMIARTNFDAEPGMPKAGSYDPKELAIFGIGHLDIQVVDQNGGLPGRRDVARILQACPDLVSSSDGRGVIVHCKGGFGRSVVLACCLAIDQFDVPGRALLGWVRVARPGSVNTPQQEAFLQGLTGRADVRRFAGLSPRDGGDSKKPNKCYCCVM